MPSTDEDASSGAEPFGSWVVVVMRSPQTNKPPPASITACVMFWLQALSGSASAWVAQNPGVRHTSMPQPGGGGLISSQAAVVVLHSLHWSHVTVLVVWHCPLLVLQLSVVQALPSLQETVL